MKDLSDQIVEHYKRWNIDIEEKFALQQFKNRLASLIGGFFKKSREEVRCDNLFGVLYGYEIDLNKYDEDIKKTFDTFNSTYIYKAISSSETIADLATVLQFFCLAMENQDVDRLDDLITLIETAVNLSPFIGIAVARQGQSVVFYRAGARLLDEGLVNDVLDWLENYPEAAKYFQRALQTYLEKDASKFRNLLDNLRFALEELLRKVLQNDKSLENQDKYLLKWLKSKGLHVQIVNSYQYLLFGPYAIYQNDAVKHKEAFSENEIEFVIYMTGIFMRQLLRLI